MDYALRLGNAALPQAGFCLVWTLLTHAVFPNLWQFTPLKKFYQTQGREQKLDFNARVTAAIHASVVFTMALYNILAVDDFVYTDVYSTNSLARLCLQLSGGYFMSDIIICRQLKEYYPEATQYLIHHIISIGGISLALRDNAAIWFVCCRLLTELSTPSVNLRFILILLKKEKTLLFVMNENFGYWAFVVSRPLLSPVFWYCTLTHWNNQLFWNLDPLLLAFWIITAGGLDALNIMWFKTISIGYYNDQIKPLLVRMGGKAVSSERKRG